MQSQQNKPKGNSATAPLRRNKMAGFILSEYVTFAILALMIIAVGYGLYVSNQRDDVVESAKQTLEAIKTTVSTPDDLNIRVNCDNTLVDSSVLDNRFLTLTIKPMRTTSDEPGYGVGVYVHSEQERDGNDVFVTAERLHESLTESEEYILRTSLHDDEKIAFGVLVKDRPVCS